MADSVPVNPFALFRLDGKVAIVTGASSGLGERFARVLHAAGARVVVAARRKERLDALVAELPGSLAVSCDLAVEAQRVNLVDEAVAHFGRVDILVNNAGITQVVGIEREEIDFFREAMEVNVTAVWHLCKLVGPHMLANGGGSVINIASMLGLVGGTPVKQANYCASKGAVVNMTRELALQWGRKGIRVNAICPGWFPSEMTEPMEDDDASQRFIKQNSPIPRMGEPQELDGPLLLLASDAGGFMTGHMLVVDGGWTAH
jgi:NAD(P)-dependent dehydrogenase (short-subunit alcohol dehydrogenase family)